MRHYGPLMLAVSIYNETPRSPIDALPVRPQEIINISISK